MNRFYLLLVAVALAAGGLLYVARSKPATVPGDNGTPVVVTAADSAFRGNTLGSDSAPVEVVEYADFQCSHCGEFAILQFPTIRDSLIRTGRLRWRLREFPLGFPFSRISSLAAQCAGEQGRYWEMADALFEHQAEWAARVSSDPSSKLRDYARSAGVDAAKYDACMDSKRYAGRIEFSHQEGLARGVGGTPTFFVNGRPLDNRKFASSDDFQHLVDSLAPRSGHKR
ncbi:MAG TPA: thioredoxin domain-containing protein [Gemmatimonadales bacterium]|nr:thioredoxin domain-containing protein [Gemmatimonadales bacterium]